MERSVKHAFGVIMPDYHLSEHKNGVIHDRLGVMTLFDDAEGCVLSYAADLRATYRRAAIYVDKILKGANPGDLPVEQPTKFDLVVNLKAAKALGLSIPAAFLLRADEVIE